VLETAIERVNEVKPAGVLQGEGRFCHQQQCRTHACHPSLKLRDASMGRRRGFRSQRKEIQPGLAHRPRVARADFDRAANETGLHAIALSAAPTVKTHPVRARVAFVHTWLGTQTEGWWRLALDNLKFPTTTISTQTVAKSDDLNSKYDVILFRPWIQLLLDGHHQRHA